MEKEFDSFETHFVKDRFGKEHEVFPALVKDKTKIRHYSAKFRNDMVIMNLITPDMVAIQKAEKAGKEIEFEDMFTDEPYNALMEILLLAFGGKYTIEQLESFVDVEMVTEIIDIFYGLSGYGKKKATLKTVP